VVKGKECSYTRRDGERKEETRKEKRTRARREED
jgi:hypothetical protein